MICYKTRNTKYIYKIKTLTFSREKIIKSTLQRDDIEKNISNPFKWILLKALKFLTE